MGGGYNNVSGVFSDANSFNTSIAIVGDTDGGVWDSDNGGMSKAILESVYDENVVVLFNLLSRNGEWSC